MSVSFRNILAAATLSSLATAAVTTLAPAIAQNGHVINAPSFSTGGGQSGNCCTGCCTAPRQHTVNVPGASLPAPNIVVGGSAATVGVNSYSIGGSTFIGGSSSQSLVVYGRNGLPVSEPMGTSVISGLNVDGAEEYVTKTVSKQLPVTEEVCAPQPAKVFGPRPIQAVCIDDKGAPHPASQIFADKTVAADYSGEVFRCMAGTYMQVTYGAMENGEPSFNGGQTMSCRKGEALIHAPGGQLSCRTQTAARNCNERSLLRRHGPGIKMVEGAIQPQACIPSTRTVMKTVSKQVKVKKASASGSLILDGGVGQGVQ